MIARSTNNGRVDEAVEVHGLVKRYDEVEAVRGVEFDVRRGETFGFLGPNGAGKSTTISMLCTLVRPTAGSALVAGHDIVRERDAVRRNIGLVFQDTTLDTYLTDPKALVPGTKMIFVGLKKPDEREALIAYLKTQN